MEDWDIIAITFISGHQAITESTPPIHINWGFPLYSSGKITHMGLGPRWIMPLMCTPPHTFNKQENKESRMNFYLYLFGILRVLVLLLKAWNSIWPLRLLLWSALITSILQTHWHTHYVSALEILTVLWLHFLSFWLLTHWIKNMGVKVNFGN